MSDPTEQDLVEAVAQTVWVCGGKGNDEATVIAELSLAALRAALPEGVVLTREGLARLGVVGAEHCTTHDDDCSWHRFRGCTPMPLFTLTRIEEQ